MILSFISRVALSLAAMAKTARSRMQTPPVARIDDAVDEVRALAKVAVDFGLMEKALTRPSW